MTAPLLAVDGIVKQFGKFTAVDDISFKLDDQESVTALIGPNGAGKTTTYNLLSGKLPLTAGRIEFKGEDISKLGVKDCAQRGLGRSFQITNLFKGVSVRENIRIPVAARSDERFRPFSRIEDNEAIAAETDRLLDLLGLREIEHRQCENLSYGQKRRVEIGITLGTDPDLVLLDEPTTGMNPEETVEIINLISDINSQRKTSFFLTEHDMTMVFSIASRILVMHRGKVIADGSPETIQADDQVQRAYLGSETSDTSLGEKLSPAISTSSGEPVLEVADIHTYYGKSHVLNGLSLTVNEGEIVALLGRNGVGKTTTLRSIMGTQPPDAGEIRLRGARINGKPVHKIARADVGYVPEERRVFTSLTVEDNISIRQPVDSRWTNDLIFDVFPILEDHREKRADQMSGGEQQMLAIARALATDPDLLLLDEPSEGLAPVIVDDLIDVIKTIADEGVTVLLTEQNVAFALELANRNYVIEGGKVEWEGTSRELLDNEEVMNKYISLEEIDV
jgi:ABC-type branched-subunit amino acid transport system ATPase component